MEAPIITLEDLLGRPSVETNHNRQLVFAACNATAAEAEAVEAHVRRCLLCPMLSQTRPVQHDAREELLKAVLDELHNTSGGLQTSDEDGANYAPLGSAVEPALAVTTAWCFTESSQISPQLGVTS